MYSDLLLPHLKREMIENYFEICCYFIMTKRFEQQEDLLRLNYYKSLLLTEPFPQLSNKSKLDLEIISCTKDVKNQTYLERGQDKCTLIYYYRISNVR